MTTSQGDKVTVRTIEHADLETLYGLIYSEESPEWKKWDAPYFPHNKISFEEYCRQIDNRLRDEVQSIMLIESKREIIGTVTYYWEHKESNWLEVGIGIYKPEYWSGGYGTDALKQWIDYLFSHIPLVRIGLTTWSGNARMIKCAEKLGMTMEARIRKARQYNGEYFDSVKMGILREEWK